MSKFKLTPPQVEELYDDTGLEWSERDQWEKRDWAIYFSWREDNGLENE